MGWSLGQRQAAIADVRAHNGATLPSELFGEFITGTFSSLGHHYDLRIAVIEQNGHHDHSFQLIRYYFHKSLLNDNPAHLA